MWIDLRRLRFIGAVDEHQFKKDFSISCQEDS